MRYAEQTTWQWNGEYPVRCQIVDVTGHFMGGIQLNTPQRSVPHLDEHGLAQLEGDRVRITLDNGETLYGDECWWEPRPPL